MDTLNNIRIYFCYKKFTSCDNT